MTFFNISSPKDLSTTTDHLSIEIAVYFGSPGQRCMGHHVEDHSTNHRGWAHGYRLHRNLIWWIKLVLSFTCTPFVAVPRGHHRHIADLGNLSYRHEWEGTSYISTKWLWVLYTSVKAQLLSVLRAPEKFWWNFKLVSVSLAGRILENIFGAICLQETWLAASADLSLLQMPGYKLIHQGHICSKHGELLIYLNDDIPYDLRTLYKHSDIWGCLFIDVSRPSL